MLREVLHSFVDKYILPTPSKEMDEYLDSVPTDKTAVQTYGLRPIVSNYYGRDKKGNELARVKIPWGNQSTRERSYHIKRTKEGLFEVTDEGILPFSGL